MNIIKILWEKKLAMMVHACVIKSTNAIESEVGCGLHCALIRQCLDKKYVQLLFTIKQKVRFLFSY